MTHRTRYLGRPLRAAAASCLAASLVAIGASSSAQTQAPPAPTPTSPPSCAESAGITLSPGFCATVFADNLGHVRHMVVAPDGVLYVNTWSGRYYHDDTPPAGGFLIALQDTKGAGRADVVQRFGPGVPQGHGHDLDSPVVPVQARLGQEHPGGV